MSTPALRGITLAFCFGGLLFWVYTFWFIARLPPGDHTGFQWLAQVPLTGITVAMILPAALMTISNRTLPFAAALVSVGCASYAFVWIQLLAEFAA